MKYIFDFDDVIFNNTKKFKEHIYETLAKAGVPRKAAEEFYKRVRANFNLESYIRDLFDLFKIQVPLKEVYEEIMSRVPEFLNTEVIDAVKKWKPENCYIITSGNEAFQREKIRRSGVGALFPIDHVYTTASTKSEALKEVCNKPGNETEEFMFFDDKPEFIREVNEGDFPNITAELYKIGDFERANVIAKELQKRK